MRDSHQLFGTGGRFGGWRLDKAEQGQSQQREYADSQDQALSFWDIYFLHTLWLIPILTFLKPIMEWQAVKSKRPLALTANMVIV